MFQQHTAFATLASSARTPARSLSPPLQAFSPSLLLSDATITPTTTTTFEPVLNVPALGTFTIIMSLALALYLRAGAIANAAEERIAALEALRDTKSKELSNQATTEQVAQAVQEYEGALRREENLRTLAPGVRIRAPNNPVTSERDQQAARQFLRDSSILPPEEDDSQRKGLSPFTVALLVTFLFGTQLFLIAFLSMDDNTATQVFNSLDDGSGSVAQAVGDLVGME